MPAGTIALMGSGELTATMVEVHKALLARLPAAAEATFLDTPAGFQLNADQISANAADYFRRRVGRTMKTASYKSREDTPEAEAAMAFQRLRESDYVLIGPGSPTYTVEQLGGSPVPGILVQRVREGACLVAASAAALTVGRFTLPVYEIYKVGRPPHWVKGLDILGAFGLDLVVVPHWNNAEGGTHDTSRCFMGEPRFRRLEAALEEPVPVLGLDEHTACIIDLADETFTVRGIGTVRLRHGKYEQVFTSGSAHPLDALRGGDAASDAAAHATDLPDAERPAEVETAADGAEEDFRRRVRSVAADFHEGLAAGDVTRAARSLLELEQWIWNAQGHLENPDVVAQARDRFRELLVLIGTRCAPTLPNLARALAPIIEELLAAREGFRQGGNWGAADAIRDAMSHAGVVVEDTAEGPRWRVEPRKGGNP